MATVPASGDVVVVGGGVIGAAVALRLADAGLDVVLAAAPADRAGQASRAAGAMLGVFSEVSAGDPPARREVDVAERLAARRLYDGWLADISDRSGIEVAVTPGLFVVGNHAGDDDEAALVAITDAALAAGSRAEPLPWREVPGLRPEPRARPFGAVHLPDEGSVDAGALLDALDATLARHPRIEVVPDRVVSVGPGDDDDATVRFRSAGDRRARQVVLAGGAETGALLAAAEGPDPGLPPVLAGRGVSVLLRAPIALPAAVRTPNRGFACGLHLVPRPGGLYLGATNRLSTAPPAGREAALDELGTLFDGATRDLNTGLRQAELLSVAVGSWPVTLDGLPLVGRTWNPCLLVATATYRNGILLAPRVAELLAGEVLAPGTGSGHPFSPRRELKVPLGAEWLPVGAGRSLLSQLARPDGVLGPGRPEELGRFLQAAVAALLDGGVADEGLRRKLLRLAERAPLEEAVPLLFETVVRHEERRRP